MPVLQARFQSATKNIKYNFFYLNSQGHQLEVEDNLETAVKECEENKFYVKVRR